MSDQNNDLDLSKRVEAFNKDLQPLLGKYNLGLGVEQFITPQGTIAGRVVIADVPKQTEKVEAAE
jgi:hypothetical protein